MLFFYISEYGDYSVFSVRKNKININLRSIKLEEGDLDSKIGAGDLGQRPRQGCHVKLAGISHICSTQVDGKGFECRYLNRKKVTPREDQTERKECNFLVH